MAGKRDRVFCYAAPMPRVTAAHEQAVRSRIVEAAARVFAVRGYHGATMQEVARESGLSIGAIYTWFRSKDELFLAGCDATNGVAMAELAKRVVRGRNVVEKLAIAIAFYLDAVDDPVGGPGMGSVLVAQWARAEFDADVRAMLRRRREALGMAGQLLVREGVATGELPAWVDVEALASAYLHLLDGMLLWRIEQGADYRREEAERRALAMLSPLIAAATAPAPSSLPLPPARPWSPHGAGRERSGSQRRAS